MLQSISLCDELTFELRDDDEISLTCDDPEIPVDESNLIVKAAQALSNLVGRRISSLTKRIPAKGGLGGGSSNAAVTLLALNHLWRRDLENTDLMTYWKRIWAPTCRSF